MPFQIEYSDEAFADFRALSPINIPPTRQLIGSFQHDRWLQGRVIADHAASNVDLRELQNGPIRLTYELQLLEGFVRILSIRAS